LESNTLLIGFDADSTNTNEQQVSENLPLARLEDPIEQRIGIGGNSLNLLQFESDFVKPVPIENVEPKKREPFEDIEELSNELMKQSLLGRSPVAQSQQNKKYD